MSDPMANFKARYPMIAGAKIALAVGLMWFLIHGGKLNTSAVTGALRHWPILLLGMMLLYLQVAIGAWRWNLLLDVQGVRLPLSKAFSLTMIGALFNIVIPGAVGGDVVKGFYVSRCTDERKAHAVTTILIDRIVGLLGLLALATLASLLDWSLVRSNRTFTALFVFTAVSFVAGCLVVWISFAATEKWATTVQGWAHRLPGSAIIDRVVESLLQYRGRPYVVLQAIAVSSVAQALCCVTFGLSALALGYDGIPVRAYLMVVPLGLVTTALPVSPGGIGVGQAAFYALFSLVPGATGAMGANTCTVFQCVTLLMNLTGLAFYLTHKRESSGEIPSGAALVAEASVEG
jgi:glycosyltransferase 2 family protein